ncbi:tRNA G10 N-methylase Trm11 [Pullulanibacillus pueri]|uniref:Methyltransferase n=1 Tax=Pullulanibacillus pueri TaxID=1437324 RepID=A0A8J3ELL5_9BACL|nr:RsmD family RNA methyltransferase [Pullulanibacillus pueri]MBM7680964.1 tRNA G10 N-methylase Trm11 [Pullulanibacillus pueri]GGH81517.1 methyltransferase [Pullulanibacillus pueri]
MTSTRKFEPTTYIYTFSGPEEELALCYLERRMLFKVDTEAKIIESPLKIDPSRSPFIKERLGVILKAATLEQLIEKIKALPAVTLFFKVRVMNLVYGDSHEKIGYEERRKIERQVGLSIRGTADLKQPDIVFALAKFKGQWIFGTYLENKSLWYHHQKKPHQYSTALSTRVARAIVNIAVPNPNGLRVIDPCCGIGTVLVEALSMGIDIVGSDNNPLVMKGARENIAYFGLKGDVILKDIREMSGHFNVAIIDMPYNLCSVVSKEEQLEMLQSARKLTERMVIVTVEPIDDIIKNAGFNIVDRCDVLKAKFKRQVIVCE